MHQSNCRFSVIIPLYNKAATISSTLDSVCRQTWNDFEVIVVDDGSSDEGYNIVSNYPDERIRYFSQKNAGVSAARNAGIRASVNPLIAFLDADDIWEPRFLETMHELIADYPEAGLYGCAFDRVKEGKHYRENYPIGEGYRGYVDRYFELAQKHHLFWTSAVVVDKNLVGRDLVFDERISLGEDLDLWFRIALKHKVAFCNQVLAHYTIDNNDRAMLRFHPFERSILFYLTKYTDDETDNEVFRQFINFFRVMKIPELMDQYMLTDQQKKAWIKSINPEGLSFMHRSFLYLPFWLQKRVILLRRMYQKYSG